ncbi:MAG: hypothetical protein IKD11_05445 [Oscillospiraceae bacterium]|nr:hypothetical protein [Oscillospiraceae bacterium]
MFNPWLAMWGIFFLGIFVIAVAVYDYADRKKRGQSIKKWAYALTFLIALLLMFPVLSIYLFYMLPIQLRSM